MQRPLFIPANGMAPPEAGSSRMSLGRLETRDGR